jgi:hypothetical protein
MADQRLEDAKVHHFLAEAEYMLRHSLLRILGVPRLGRIFSYPDDRDEFLNNLQFCIGPEFWE